MKELKKTASFIDVADR